MSIQFLIPSVRRSGTRRKFILGTVTLNLAWAPWSSWLRMPCMFFSPEMCLDWPAQKLWRDDFLLLTRILLWKGCALLNMRKLEFNSKPSELERDHWTTVLHRFSRSYPSRFWFPHIAEVARCKYLSCQPLQRIRIRHVHLWYCKRLKWISRQRLVLIDHPKNCGMMIFAVGKDFELKGLHSYCMLKLKFGWRWS